MYFTFNNFLKGAVSLTINDCRYRSNSTIFLTKDTALILQILQKVILHKNGGACLMVVMSLE